MVTIKDALELIKAGFTVDDIRAMDKPSTEPDPTKPDPTEPDHTNEKFPAADDRLDKLAGIVENLVETVGKLPFAYSMGDYNKEQDVNNILASIINPGEKKGDK